MTFSSPLALLLLAALPFLAWLGWPSRGPSRLRETLSLAVRLLLALLLVLGLAGAELRRAADQLSVVYLVDHSDSMPALAQQTALAYVRQALQEMGPNDRSAVIVFGGDALVERPLSTSKDLDSFTTQVSSLQTDLAEAIRLGLALLPADTARRMVILSDGLETTGEAAAAARLAAASGVQIMVVPFRPTTTSAEAIVTEVNAPAHLREGEQFGLEVTIESTVDQTVGVLVFADAALAHEGTLALRRGTNAYSLPLTATEPGFSRYRVQIVPLEAADTFYQNNELAAFSQVAGPPRVLLVKNPSPRDGVDESRELIAALQAANLLVDVVEPSGLPSDLAELAEYVSVVMVNVPASQITRQMDAVQTYVRDLGGGLVVVGGPNAYGVGGYFKTPLEATLPVDMQIKDQLRRPRLTIVFIIDHSGSMTSISGGVTKLDLAKEAAIRSLDLLSPTDKVGVIAFDDTASWVVPISSLENRDAIANAIGTIRADGGTSIIAGVAAAEAVLPNDDAAVKHIILLTDGGAETTGLIETITAMRNDFGITLSAVGVGSDAAPILPALAEAGGGIYHFAADPSSIPSIFTEEISLATRAYIIEEEFAPKQVNPSPMLAGIEGVPSLLGYVGTSAKDSAQTILVTGQDDPLLAAWQYGLGRSVAWTSDATGRWARNWVTWDQFVRFWAQVVRYTITEGAQSNVEVRVERTGEQATVTVDAQSEAGAYLNGLTMQVNVVGPDGATQTLTLQQIAPGRYAGDFVPTAEGAYLIRVAGSEGDAPVEGQGAVAQTAGWVLSYSPEYQTLTADPGYLARLANLTGGGLVGDDLAAIYAHDLPAARAATRPIWPYLLLVAALLLPLDIGLRRLVVTRYELQRAWRRFTGWATLRPTQAAPVQRTQQLSSLLRAKDRAGTAVRDDPAQDPRPNAPPPIVTTPPAAPPPSQPVKSPAPIAEKQPSPAPVAHAKPAPANTSSALLAKKRAREKKD